jgi:hypothetical protein
MRDCKSEIDIDINGNAIWVVHFYEDDEFAFSVAYRFMDVANEAKRRWLVGTAVEFADLTEVDRFKDDVII